MTASPTFSPSLPAPPPLLDDECDEPAPPMSATAHRFLAPAPTMTRRTRRAILDAYAPRHTEGRGTDRKTYVERPLERVGEGDRSPLRTPTETLLHVDYPEARWRFLAWMHCGPTDALVIECERHGRRWTPANKVRRLVELPTPPADLD